MLFGRITPTICFGGNCYSISALRTYCCINGALIMPRSYYSSRAYSGSGPKTIGGTSFWALSGVCPDFSRQLCEQTVLRLMCSGSHTVFTVASVRSCHAGGFSLAATLIPSGSTSILATPGGPTLRFGANTFVVLGWCGRFYQ